MNLFHLNKKYQGEDTNTKGLLEIRFVHRRMSNDFWGEGVKSKAVHDISVKHKKDKKLFLHIDFLSHTKAIKHCLLLYKYCLSGVGTNIYTFNRAPV